MYVDLLIRRKMYYYYHREEIYQSRPRLLYKSEESLIRVLHIAADVLIPLTKPSLYHHKDWWFYCDEAKETNHRVNINGEEAEPPTSVQHAIRPSGCRNVIGKLGVPPQTPPFLLRNCGERLTCSLVVAPLDRPFTVSCNTKQSAI